jgi:hypothetical protein
LINRVITGKLAWEVLRLEWKYDSAPDGKKGRVDKEKRLC